MDQLFEPNVARERNPFIPIPRNCPANSADGERAVRKVLRELFSSYEYDNLLEKNQTRLAVEKLIPNKKVNDGADLLLRFSFDAGHHLGHLSKRPDHCSCAARVLRVGLTALRLIDASLSGRTVRVDCSRPLQPIVVGLECQVESLETSCAMWLCEKCREKIDDQFDSCWKCAGEPDKIGLPLGARMKESHRQIVRGVLLALGLIPATWLCFGPVAAFHHMYGFGITFYLMLNGEDPRPGDYMWGDYAVRFFPVRFVLGLVLWLISVFIVFKSVRFLSKRQYVP